MEFAGLASTAGLIQVEKAARASCRAWITLTPAGRAALADEITRLNRLMTPVPAT